MAVSLLIVLGRRRFMLWSASSHMLFAAAILIMLAAVLEPVAWQVVT